VNLVRARNTILAGILGDTWGGPFDSSVAPQRALFAGARTLSDDTWLALATCEAISRHGGGVGADGVASVFLDWYSQKRFRAVGSATLNALRDLESGVVTKSSAAGTAGSGGVAVRVATLAFVLDPREDGDRRRLEQIVRITHQDDDAYVGALAQVEAIRVCLQRPAAPHDLPSIVANLLPDSPLREQLAALDRLNLEAGALVDTGDAVTAAGAVPLAIVIAARGSDSLEAALKMAAGTGSHSDTVAALTGQIVGAAGQNVPRSLLNGLPEIAEIEQLVERFVQGVGGAITCEGITIVITGCVVRLEPDTTSLRATACRLRAPCLM
jgi:ADP-ribosylglycohydrolase